MELEKEIKEIKAGLSIIFDEVKMLKNINMQGVKEEGYRNMFVDGSLLVIAMAINMMDDFERNLEQEKTSTSN